MEKRYSVLFEPVRIGPVMAKTAFIRFRIAAAWDTAIPNTT